MLAYVIVEFRSLLAYSTGVHRVYSLYIWIYNKYIIKASVFNIATKSEITIIRRVFLKFYAE